jgi:uncharacterized membrane protein
MPHVEQSIEINTSANIVFDYIANQPEHIADWWSSFELQARVTPAPTAVGSVSRYVYNMVGVKIKGEHKVLELTPNRLLKVKTISGIESTFDFVFAPRENGCLLTVRVDYALPGSFLGQLMNRMVIEEKNEKSLRDGLATLKGILEAKAQQA